MKPRNVSKEIQRIQARDYSADILWSVFAIEPEVTTVVAVSDLRQDPKEIRRALRERV
jgi:hypothetical protein